MRDLNDTDRAILVRMEDAAKLAPDDMDQAVKRIGFDHNRVLYVEDGKIVCNLGGHNVSVLLTGVAEEGEDDDLDEQAATLTAEGVDVTAKRGRGRPRKVVDPVAAEPDPAPVAAPEPAPQDPAA